MITHIYTLIVIRHFKHIGDSLSALTFDNREAAEAKAKAICEENRDYEISTAITEMITAVPDTALRPMMTSLSFGVRVNRTSTPTPAK